MKTIFKFTKSDIKLFLIYFLFAVPISILATDEPITWRDFIAGIWFIISSFCSVYIVVFILFERYIVQKKYFLLFFYLILVYFLIGAVDICFYSFLFDEFDDVKELLENPWFFILAAIISQTENIGVLFGVTLGKKIIESQIQLFKREKEQKVSELRLLKAQLDPHFLFNNLNTLDALIDTDPNRSKIFIQRLSKIYRYILTTKDEELASLSKELSFSEDYSYLIKERFGDSYNFEVIFENKNNLDHKFIPTGSIQLLIENIVKHNVGTTLIPIYTTITVTNNCVIVRNNIRRKRDNVNSFGIGLSSLTTRYEILSDKSITIDDTSDYVVTLPLIQLQED